MRSAIPWLLPALPVLLAACATATGTAAGPALEIPVFAADDARAGTAGFVGQTQRVHVDAGGKRYTLMAFRVGDTWTLGAMVKGDFAGDVRWRIDDRGMRIPFATSAPSGKSPVFAEPGGAQVAQAEGASFRGTAWTNVDLPAACLRDGSTVQLTFAGKDGTTIVLPAEGTNYVVREARR